MRNHSGAAVASLIALFALTLASCGKSAEADTSSSKGKGKGRGGPVPVVTAVAAVKDVPIEIDVVGNVEAYSTVSLRAQVNGQLTIVALHDGDYVHKGDLLFTIDQRQIDGQLKQAEANLARSTAQFSQAKSALARDIAQAKYLRGIAENYTKLGDEGIFAKDQVHQAVANADAAEQVDAADQAAIDSAQAQIDADKAAIDNIRIQKTYTTIAAPIDGRSGTVTQKLGNIVSANTTELAVLNQVEPIYVSFSVPEGRLNEIKSYYGGGSLPVSAQPQDAQGQSSSSEHGKLTFIDNAVDTSTGTIRLKGTFENKGHVLWPGQFVNATLRLTTRQNAVTVPNQAVQNGQNGTFIYVVGDDRKAEFRPVKVGPRIGLDLVIDDGVKAGETVVTDGQLRLQPGSAVRLSGEEGGGPALPNTTSGDKAPDQPKGKGKGKGKGKQPGYDGA